MALVIDQLELERLDTEGLKTLLRWADEEGWNPGPHDAEVFYATDPAGFYGYYYNGELIAGGAVVSYNGEFGFMGLFIVSPAYRPAGIGRQLWYHRRDTLLSRLKAGASIGMDGVIAMQPFYTKGGFEIAFRDERYENTGRKFEINEHISPVTDNDVSAILEYDKECFGFARPQFMKSWLQLPGTKSYKYVEDGLLKGFAIIRRLNRGCKICPLFADDMTVAARLYEACLDAAQSQQVYIDIPVTNSAAVQLVKDYSAGYVFECARMYYGQPPVLPIHKIYGITTFELG